jgi:hypothetical protein
MITKAEVVEHARQFIDLCTVPDSERRELSRMASERLVWPHVADDAAAAHGGVGADEDAAFWRRVRLLATEANKCIECVEDDAQAEALSTVKNFIRNAGPAAARSTS